MRRRIELVIVVIGLLAFGVYTPLHFGTPSNQTTPGPITQASNVAPGVSQNDIVKPGQLYSAHRSSLRNQSYTLTTVLTITHDNDTKRGQRVSVARVHATRNQIEYRQRSSGTFPISMQPQPAVDLWFDGNRTLLRLAIDDESRYSTYASDIVRDATVFDSAHVVRLSLDRADRPRVRLVTYDGWQAYRIDSTAGTNDSRVVTVVDSFGQIRTFRGTFAARTFFYRHQNLFDWWPLPFRRTVLGDNFSQVEPGDRVTYTIRYDGIGNTTVTRPSWVDQMPRATENVSVTQPIAS